MDDTDRKIALLISQNARIHLQELARRLGMTRQAVYNRVQALEKAGVLKGTFAGVSVGYLDAVPVVIQGRSSAPSMIETLDRLGESELTRRVLIAGGNYIYAIGFLRNLSDLDGYTEFVRQAADMSQPMVGIYNLDEELMPYVVDGAGRRRKRSYRKLSSLDLRIIASLRDDARRSIADVAGAIGASTKTVRRHLEDMIADGSVDFDTPMDMQSGGDLFLVMHVNLKDDADRVTVGRRLLSKGMFHDQYIRTFSNIPGLLCWVFWSDDMSKIREAVKETSSERDVRSVLLNFVFIERLYPTWRDELLENAALARRRKTRSRTKTR